MFFSISVKKNEISVTLIGLTVNAWLHISFFLGKKIEKQKLPTEVEAYLCLKLAKRIEFAKFYFYPINAN